MTKKTRIEGDLTMKIKGSRVLDFFESRASDENNANHLTMTMYQSAELAFERDQHEKNIILPKLKLSELSNVLDVGCGNGRWYESINSFKLNYTGVDLSPSLIKIAQEKYAGDSLCHFHVYKADDISSDTISLNSGPFTHVIISGVMLYMNDSEISVMFDNLSDLISKNTLVYLREPLALNSRLTLNEHWSDDLGSNYSAIYRTHSELFTIINSSSNKFHYEIVEANQLYPSSLNNRKETQQYYYILRMK